VSAELEVTEARNESPQAMGERLLAEAGLVADLVTSALAVLHSSDAGVSLIGEFMGLVAITGGIGTSVFDAAEEQYKTELAKYFATQLERAAATFRRMEAGQSVEEATGRMRVPGQGTIIPDEVD